MAAPLSSYLNTDKTGVRKYLNDQGYNDSQIGYSNGNVSLNGKSFMNATPDADGSTYASRGSLQDALKQYKTADNTSRVNSLTDTMYSKVNEKPFEFKQQQSPFNYDPNSDQAYQAALNSAKSNIQTGQNNTLANLLAHGQGNSSYAASAAQQIANKEMGNVSNNILPELISQSYQRYKDQNASDYQNQLANYNAGQDQLKNQSSLASVLDGSNQQQFNNDRLTESDARQKQQDHISLANLLSEQYGVPVDPKDDPSLAYSQVQGLKPLSMREYEDRRSDNTFDQKYKTDTQNFSQWLDKQQLGVSQANSGTSASNAGFNRMLDIWDRTGQAPAGLESMGIKPGTTLNDKAAVKEAEKVAAEKAKKMESEKTGLANALNSGDISYSDAEKSIQKDLAMGFYTSNEAAELNTLLKNWAAAAYGQRNN